MKKILASAALIFAAYSTLGAMTMADIASRLRQQGCLTADVKYKVYLPTSSDPVEYTIGLMTSNVPDSLSPSDYLITWELPRGDKSSTGFSSYYNGDHFRYRDTRLQEYHFADDPRPFQVDGGGVQHNAQFADLLPAFLAEKLDEMAADSNYTYRFNEKSNTIEGTMSMQGYDALEFTYQFGPDALPRHLDFVYNPASISEQIVSVDYTWDTSGTKCHPVTEDYLISLFGDIFGKFRTSNFRVESMRGAPVPAFSYDVAGSGRFSHSRGEADLPSAMLLAFLDADVQSTASVVDDLRSTVASVPMPVTVVYVFADNETPADFEPQGAEYIANGPQGFITKCGVTAYPTMLLVGRDGIVTLVKVGTSTDLVTELSQALMVM